MKTKREYKESLNSLIEEYSKVDARIKKMGVNIKRYCSNIKYRSYVNYRIRHYKQLNEKANRRMKTERWRAARKEWIKNNPEKLREANRKSSKKYYENNPEIRRRCFERWIINNPRRAMLTAASARVASAVISRLWIRPTVCPHCGRETPNMDFHHPNHLFWWKWTFCCKSCHYFFNRDKVPASDKIIDLKRLLRESLSH